MKYNMKQYRRYVFVTWLITRDYKDELNEFEASFMKSCHKNMGKLSNKQVRILEKIVSRFFVMD